MENITPKNGEMTPDEWFEIEEDMEEVVEIESDRDRWVTTISKVFRYEPDKTFWLVHYQVPNTEYQEGSEDENYYLCEVEAYETVTTKYRPKDKV